MDEDFPSDSPKIVGFHTYADDTPRPLDSTLAGWTSASEDDEDDPSDAWEPEPFAPSTAPIDEPPVRRGLIAAALIVAVAAVAGIATLRITADRNHPPAPAPVAATPSNLHIQLAQAPPPSAAAAAAPDAAIASTPALRLEMLRSRASPQDPSLPDTQPSRTIPPKTASQGPLAAVDLDATAPASPAAPASSPQLSAAPDTPEPQLPQSAAPAAPRSQPPERSAGRSGLPGQLDCDRPASPGEQLICGDAELLAADRRMAQAYARADAAGVPDRILRAEQVGWLNAREAASHRSRDAVDRLYRQRIRDLDSEAAASR